MDFLINVQQRKKIVIYLLSIRQAGSGPLGSKGAARQSHSERVRLKFESCAFSLILRQEEDNEDKDHFIGGG